MVEEAWNAQAGGSSPSSSSSSGPLRSCKYPKKDWNDISISYSVAVGEMEKANCQNAHETIKESLVEQMQNMLLIC